MNAHGTYMHTNMHAYMHVCMHNMHVIWRWIDT